jgi:NTE family protein
VLTDSPPAESLRAVPLFAELPAHVLEQIAGQVKVHHLSSGEWLFREGDAGDSAHVVLSGRLEIVTEGQDLQVLRVLGRGSVVGEVALLTGRDRTASVRALRDSQLLRIARGDFENLLLSEPSAGAALTRQLGSQLADNLRPTVEVPPPPVTIALISLDQATNATQFARELGDALALHGTVGHFDERSWKRAATAGERMTLVDRLEHEHDRVLLVGSASVDDPFTAFCTRQADRVVAIGDAAYTPRLPTGQQLRNCDLALRVRGRSASAVSSWVEQVNPRALHLLPAESYDVAVARCARRLAGCAVGVVMSGGGARGFAHIGAIEQLLAAGVQIDRIGGCSIGAYIGALFAAGGSVEEVRARCRQEFVARNPLRDYTLPLVAFTRGRRGLAMLTRSFGDLMIEELPLEYYCTASDLIGNVTVEHRRGPLITAVGSSVAMPAFVPPVVVGDRILVDGGVLNNLPVAEMAVRGEGPVVAIDVTAPTRHPGSGRRRFRRPRARRMTHRLHAWITGAEETPLALPDAITRSVVLGSADTVAAARRHADLVIAPHLPDVEMLDYHRLEHAIEAGRAAARAALAQAPAGLRGG